MAVLRSGNEYVRRVGSSEQVHVDLGALAQRVTGTEAAIDNIGRQVRDLSVSIGEQMRDLGSKVQARPTNWVGLASAAAAMVGVMLAIGSAIMVPVFGDIRQIAEDLKAVQTLSATKAEIREINDTMRGRFDKTAASIQSVDDKKVSIREHDEYKAHIESRIDGLEKAQTARTFELEKTLDGLVGAITSRLDALSIRVGEGQEQAKTR